MSMGADDPGKPDNPNPVTLLSELSRGFTSYEMLLMTQGLTPKQARAKAAEEAELYTVAKAFVNLPVNKWPQFEVKWDLSPSSFHWALDGEKPESVADLELVVVKSGLAALDVVLSHSNWREADELWTLGDPKKLARVLAHCSKGRPLTPPWITPDSGKIRLVGGNHRLAMCRAKGLPVIPLLVEKPQLEQVKAILPVQHG